jgi:hypothetical protein
MGIYELDLSAPLDLNYLVTRDRHGEVEAVCEGCGAWVRLGKFYKGDRLVIRQIPHNPPCETYEQFVRDWAQTH